MALLLAAVACAPALALSSPGASAAPAAAATAPAALSSAGGAPGATPTAMTAPADNPTGPLPSLQGHEGVDISSIPVPDEDLVSRYVDGLLATRGDWLQAVLDRSARYRPAITRALAERGMPPDLQFLPAVESGFVDHAVSPRGAAGLWQLMRNTASPYGLRMDLWLDERRDLDKATFASLQKLAANYAAFGDWYLALAAYNCGAGRLAAIMRRNPGSDYWDLRRRGALPRETAGFVPQFLAIAQILGHAGRYGLDLSWDPPPAWAEVPLDRPVDLRKLAEASGAPLAELRDANPELNYLVTPPSSYAFHLKVPADYRDAVSAALESSDMPLMEFQVHDIASGDTLFGMSLRYGVSLSLIQEFNPSVNPKALHIGAKVLIPQLPGAR